MTFRYVKSVCQSLSEASVYRLLKDHGLITSPAFILMKARAAFNPNGPVSRARSLSVSKETFISIMHSRALSNRPLLDNPAFRLGITVSL